MASISVPCSRCSLRVAPVGRPRPPLLAGSARLPRVHGPSQSQSLIVKAKVSEVAVESSSNSSPLLKSELEAQSSSGVGAKVVEESAPQAAVPESVISTFMEEVLDLVKLVDTRDIVELQLKQKDCELLIRKKEALPQPASTAPLVMMQPPPQAMPPPQAPLVLAAAPPTPSSPSPSAPAPALPPPAKASSSSLPPLKCPMAGTFYRCPAPGEPPFVKVGDKVQKGQVVCILEAMKLMNEIEADQSGTIIEIIAEDGKPVSVDTPLLIIQP